MSELAHKRAYEAALRSVDYPGPAWEDLTDEQRANIRKANEESWRFMADLGEAIRTGGPLPRYGGEP